MSLIKIGSETYIMDFKAIDNLIAGGDEFKPSKEEETETTYNYVIGENGRDGEKLISKRVVVKEYNKGKEIDVSKYETLRLLVDIVMNHNEEIDESLGVERAMRKMPIPFKIAFNTLKYYQILKTINLD